MIYILFFKRYHIVLQEIAIPGVVILSLDMKHKTKNRE
jgi:hypothetical protein